jgi:hypothetical protein
MAKTSDKPIYHRRMSAAQLRRRWRNKRTHQQLYDASDWLRSVEVDATGFARVWIGVGLQIAASHLEELANEILVEDIINDQ